MRGADICDNGNYYSAYFSTTYDQPFVFHGTWQDGTLTAGRTEAGKDSADTGADFRHDTGAWVTFADGAQVTARTGLSYVSVENAAENRDAEVGATSFDDVRGAAKAAWTEALGTVDATGGTDEERTKLYTALYHAMLHPNVRNDVNGEYRGYDGQTHQVEDGRDFYQNFAGSGWDMYRSQIQLIALTHPEVAADIAESIVLLHDQTGGWQPGAARMQGDSLQVMIATLDDMGITDYRREDALAGMLSTQVLPASGSDRTDAFQYFATGMIENRKNDFATSRVLEYSVDDFAIAQLAERLGDTAAHDTFMARSQSWMNVFDPQSQQIRPRERTGFDRAMNLQVREDGSGRGQFNQSTGLQYGWMVPHNLGTLIERKGGVAASTAALDSLMADLDAGAYDKSGNYLSNQPAMNTPWVYNWLGAPHEATDVLYRAATEMYDTTPAGLPGNDDQGSLSAWYAFATMGVYPAIYGTGDLVVTAPMFEHLVIDPVGSDRAITISAPGASSTNRYTRALSVNGTPQTASWVDADFVRTGGTLDFTMGAVPGTWGTGPDDAPPSYTDGVDARNSIGTTPAGRGELGSMDLSDWSFSRETLATAGAAPGQQIPHGDTGITFTWPDTAPGEPDNWIPHGQRIDLADEQAGAIAFLGLATNGPARGTAVVEYTDGSTQDVVLELTDWAAQPGAGSSTLVQVSGRNNGANSTGTGTFRVFGTKPVSLDATKTVDAVRLPLGSDQGVMHVFDVATRAGAWTDPDAPDGTPERVVLNPTADPSTSQYVTWRSRSALPLTGSVEVRPVGGTARTVAAEQKPERTVDGYPARSHSARIEGLTPGTEYQYRVLSGDRASGWFSFTTASAGADPFTFLYFGDAQEGIDSVWHQTVDAAVAAHPDAELGLYAGDLVNTATIEQEWTDWFAGVEGVGDRTNVLTTLGNHEIGGQPRIETYTDSFEYDANGPVPSDAGEYATEYGEHLASVLKDTVYVTDYQGVRFVNLNANRDDICTIVQPPGSTSSCDTGRKAWMTAQATWLDRVLRENPHEWSVVLAHQPVFSTGVSGNGLRDEADWRQYVLPVLERRNVDLVLQGHDHTYGRGYHGSTGTDLPGVSAGPVYVVSNAGQKQYTLPAGDDHIWNRNGATAVVRAQDTSTYQAISVDGDTLSYSSVVTYTRPGGAATVAVGDELDAFTITKRADGAKWVTEQGTAVPGPEVAPVNVQHPSGEAFDDVTFGEVAWDDDFDTDRLGEYEAFGDIGEAAADLAVDTDAGVLTATAPGRRWSHLALPVDPAERFALVVEPASFVGTGTAEDSLFVGLTDGPQNRAHSWFNNTRSRGGIDVVVGGQAKGLSAGVGDRAVAWEPGVRFATVVDHGELTSWIERDGTWSPIRTGMLDLTMTHDQLAGWAPTVSLRLDAGTIAIDRITLLQAEVADTVVTPGAVTFHDALGTAADTYTVPLSTGVEYVVDGAVVTAGTHAGTGTVTVTARALDGFALTDGAQSEWTFAFTDLPVDPGPGEPGPGEPGGPGQPGDPGTDPGSPPIPAPGTPGTPGTPAPPTAGELVDGTRGGITVTGPVTAGGTVTVTVGTQHAGTQVRGWLFSTPVDLGVATVNASGETMFRIPADTAPGQHRIAVTAADGTLIGWAELTVAASDTARPGALASTGATVGTLALLAAMLIVTGAVLALRRRSAGQISR